MPELRRLAWRPKLWLRSLSSTGSSVSGVILTPEPHQYLLSVMVLNITLFSLAITQSSRGNSNIWTSYVTEADFSAPAPAPNPQVAMDGKVAYPVQGFPQQQPQFVPQ